MKVTFRAVMLAALFAAGTAGLAAPPRLPTKQFKATANQPVVIPVEVADDEADLVVIQAFQDDPASPVVFEEFRPTKGKRKFFFQAPKAGVYAITFATKGETVGDYAVVTVGGTGVADPPPVQPPTQPPTDPPTDPPKWSKLYFLVIRPNGDATAEFTRQMSDPGWDRLEKDGYTVKDKTVDAAKQFGIELAAGQTLPVVVTLRVSPDGKASRVARGAVPMPTATLDIIKLAEGVP